MAIFYESKPITVAAEPALEDALTTDPATISQPSVTAANKANEIARSVKGKFSWKRLVGAIVLLGALLVPAIYTAHDEALVDLYKVLLHSFELVLGGVIALLLGESTSR